MKKAAVVAMQVLLSSSSYSVAQECKIEKSELNVASDSLVGLVRRETLTTDSNFILFRAKLGMSTDGSPASFNPKDPLGKLNAINTIPHGFKVKKGEQKVSKEEAVKVFNSFYSHSWKAPNGYDITWKNRITSTVKDGVEVPCIFQSGKYKGYFGTKTALKNGLSYETSGECQSDNQIDQSVIPGIIIPKDDNPVKHMNAELGDLVVALNVKSGVIAAALAVDNGSSEDLGSGSIALNTTLRGESNPPKNFIDIQKLEMQPPEIVFAILPKTVSYNLARPYTKASIEQRVDKWLREFGYGTLADFSTTMKNCMDSLK